MATENTESAPSIPRQAMSMVLVEFFLLSLFLHALFISFAHYCIPLSLFSLSSYFFSGSPDAHCLSHYISTVVVVVFAAVRLLVSKLGSVGCTGSCRNSRLVTVL